MKIENSVIEQCITGLKETLDTFIIDNKEEHAKIIEQTTKTNGNVREIQLWKAGMAGQMKVIGFIIGAIIIPLGFLLFERFFIK